MVPPRKSNKKLQPYEKGQEYGSVVNPDGTVTEHKVIIPGEQKIGEEGQTPDIVIPERTWKPSTPEKGK